MPARRNSRAPSVGRGRADHDDRLRAPRQQCREHVVLARGVITRLRQDHGVAERLQFVGQALHRIGEDRIRNRRHQHADRTGAGARRARRPTGSARNPTPASRPRPVPRVSGATMSGRRTTRLTVIDDTPANLATADSVGAVCGGRVQGCSSGDYRSCRTECIEFDLHRPNDSANIQMIALSWRCEQSR